MSFFKKLFSRSKEEEKIVETQEVREVTELEELCRGFPKVYEALKDTMLLDPKKIDVDLKEAINKARELEKAGDTLRAAVWYRIAGGLAIYQADVRKVKELFGKYTKLTGITLKILEIPEEAVEKAQEYYNRYLKPEKNHFNK